MFGAVYDMHEQTKCDLFVLYLSYPVRKYKGFIRIIYSVFGTIPQIIFKISFTRNRFFNLQSSQTKQGLTITLMNFNGNCKCFEQSAETKRKQSYCSLSKVK